MSHITRSERSTLDHVEFGDLKDLHKIKDYLKLYSPLRFDGTNGLVSLSSDAKDLDQVYNDLKFML